MKKDDIVLFDHMGQEYEGSIVDILTTFINDCPHKIIVIGARHHRLSVNINITLFPNRVRPLKKEKVKNNDI